MDNFSISISKEQLAELPVVTFSGKISVIERPDDAIRALKFLETQPIVGFDTETKPSFRKGRTNTVCLIQVSTEDHAFLFRLNKLGFIEELRRFIENSNTKKIGLSLKDDFFVLHKIKNFNPEGFIDLQQLVRQFNITDSSLQKIYGIIFGGRISKNQRLSNWEAQTLTPGQQHYAAIDAWACLRLYKNLSEGEFIPENSKYLKPENEQV